MDKTKRSVLINPIVARDITEHGRTATPLELFYDLIYVVAIATLAAQLHHAVTDMHHVGHAILMYLLLFFAIWWPWNSYTWFASGFDTDDAQFRVASLAQMVGVMLIAAGVEPAFTQNEFTLLLIGYVIMRIPAILLWFKVAYDDPRSRPVAIRYAIGILLVQVAWAVNILLFSVNIYVSLVLALCEMLVPYIAESAVNKGQNTTYHFEHIEERLGLMTIIVLGEAILASVNAVNQAFSHFTPELLSMIAGSVLILFSMWWLYFDDKLEERLEHQDVAFIWSYGHYVIYAAAAAVGALVSVNVDTLTEHAKISYSAASGGLAIAVAIYLVAVWLCHDFLMKKQGFKMYELLILAVAVLVIAATTHSVLLMGLAFVSLNSVRLLRRHKQYKTAVAE